MVKISSMLTDFPSENVIIVDALNLAFRWKHSGQAKFVQDYLTTVRSLARSYQAGKIIIAADWGGSQYRREIFPDYKANRKEIYANDSEEEKAATKRFFDEYEAALEALDQEFTVLRYKGVEADDIAAFIVTRRRDFGLGQIWLISSDRDWDLLVEADVHRFSYVTRKEQTLDTWDNPVPPELYIDYKCLVGDKGDNIPGVPGVGPVRATALLEQYGSLMDICDNIPLEGKYKYIQAINEFGSDQLQINMELMDLRTFCEEAVGKENTADIFKRLVQE